MTKDKVPFLHGGPLGYQKYHFQAVRVKFGCAPGRGSEHSLNGIKYDVETQFIYAAASNDVPQVILSTFFYEANEGVDIPMEIMNGIKHEGNTHYYHNFPLNIGQFWNSETVYAFYVGTNTSPPCAPGIKWFINLRPLPVTTATVSLQELFWFLIVKNVFL